MSLEYTATFSESDVIGDIAKKMRDKFSVLSIEESRKLAQESLTQIRGQGNSALYNGLVTVGLEYAILSYQQSGSEGPLE